VLTNLVEGLIPVVEGVEEVQELYPWVRVEEAEVEQTRWR